MAAAVRRRLVAVIDAKRQMHDDLVIVTGLNLGTETLAAEAAVEAGAPHVAVLAHPGQEKPWSSDSKLQFARLTRAARETVTLQRKTPDSKQKIGASYRRRDAWLARNADEAVAVWDGAEQYVGRAVRSLQDALGEENVWVIDPNELA
jgi:uncharacterized phage-like protein YoqJ